jgi:hypothetical protein
MNDEMTILDAKGSLIHDTQGIANAFNDYFSSVIENLLNVNQDASKMKQTIPAPKHDSPIISNKLYPNMKYNSISTQEIEKSIKSLKSKTSSWI